MNRLAQLVLLVLFPFYPLWAWLFNFITNKNISNFINVLWLPLVVLFLLNKNNRFPKYLIFLLLFTGYHLGSVYIFDLLPDGTTWFKYIIADFNVTACAIFFLVENIEFDKGFYE